MAGRKGIGVKKLVDRLLKDGLSNPEILEVVKVEIPNSRTSLGCINWHRCELRDVDDSIPTSREVKNRRQTDENI